jgi:hypothetical protein
MATSYETKVTVKVTSSCRNCGIDPNYCSYSFLKAHEGGMPFDSPGPQCPGPGTYALVRVEESK